MPYTFVRFIVAPLLQKEYIGQSVTSHGMAELSEQGIESIGRIHVKNVSERQGSGHDHHTLKIIGRRTIVLNSMGLLNNIISYFKDLKRCHNLREYPALWSDEHIEELEDVIWRSDRSSFVLNFIFFNLFLN